MLLALLALALVALILVVPTVTRALSRRGARRAARRAAARRRHGREPRDPGRERRAEQRARELLRSCVNDEEWAMYRDLGFIRVYGRLADGSARAGEGRLEERPSVDSGARRPWDSPELPGDSPLTPEPPTGAAPYAYLIYPHKPLVAYVPRGQRLLSEYCVEFPDLTGAISRSRLPDSDDVLAKWMALTGDERRLIRDSNMHLPGRQVDPARVRRDLWRLAEWERERASRGRSGGIQARRP